MYIMDDNLINTKKLCELDSEKIIFSTPNLQQLKNYTGSWWDLTFDGKYGKRAVESLINDNRYASYKITKYGDCISDELYLPSAFITYEFIELIKLFSQHNVFIEIALPTIINNLFPDNSLYNNYERILLYENAIYDLLNMDYLKNCLLQAHFIHPFKFGEYKQFENLIKQALNDLS
jgi:hypothetical protein